MKIVKKINNNVAIGRDQANREVVVFGKGIGFADGSYELTDLSRIDRTYYDIDPKYVGLLNEIPEHIFTLVSKLLEISQGKTEYAAESQSGVYSGGSHTFFHRALPEGNLSCASLLL